MEDLKWFIHYCLTINSKKDVKTASSQLLKYVNEEAESILLCEECYNNAYQHSQDSFVMPCKTPHLILWALSEGYGYWPAKAMTVNLINRTVHVRFFSDHSTAEVPEGSCFLYSKECPDTTGRSLFCLESYQLAIRVSFNIH